MLLLFSVNIMQSNSCNLHGIEYDFIGHLENLEEDMATVMKHTHLPAESAAAARRFFKTKSGHATNALAEASQLYKNKVSHHLPSKQDQGKKWRLPSRSNDICVHPGKTVHASSQILPRPRVSCFECLPLLCAFFFGRHLRTLYRRCTAVTWTSLLMASPSLLPLQFSSCNTHVSAWIGHAHRNRERQTSGVCLLCWMSKFSQH